MRCWPPASFTLVNTLCPRPRPTSPSTASKCATDPVGETRVSSSLPPPSLDQVLDLMLDAVCVVDRDGRFLYVSAASEQVFGYTPEEMVGRMVWDLVHPEDHDLTRAQAERVMSGNSSTQIENRYIRKDGSVAHIMWSARWSERDQVRIGVARDVTRRKHAERAQDALLRISQAA